MCTFLVSVNISHVKRTPSRWIGLVCYFFIFTLSAFSFSSPWARLYGILVPQAKSLFPLVAAPGRGILPSFFIPNFSFFYKFLVAPSCIPPRPPLEGLVSLPPPRLVSFLLFSTITRVYGVFSLSFLPVPYYRTGRHRPSPSPVLQKRVLPA